MRGAAGNGAVPTPADTQPDVSHVQGTSPLVQAMRRCEGLTETGGDNRGEPIWETWTRALGYTSPQPWCGIAVATKTDEAGVTYPTVRSGKAIHYKTKESLPASWFKRQRECPPTGWLAVHPHHVGVVTGCQWRRGRGWTVTTISGNTSNPTGGPRDGIFEKTRSMAAGSNFKPSWFTPVRYG